MEGKRELNLLSKLARLISQRDNEFKYYIYYYFGYKIITSTLKAVPYEKYNSKLKKNPMDKVL